MTPKTHEIKCYPRYFTAIEDGLKPFEVRRNDRGYQVGDRLLLVEYHPVHGFSGRRMLCRVTYVLTGGNFGIDPDYCVMGISIVKEPFREDQ